MGKFLAGLAVGVGATLVLGLLLMLILSPSVVKSIALDDLATYRQCVSEAPLPPAEKEAAIARLDRIIERVRKQGIGFWEYAVGTADLDPLVADKVLTAEEWPQFESELRAAEIVLAGAPQAEPRPSPEAAPVAQPAKN